jgi:RNA polymerase sigma-70 factor (sigma-E family)
VTRKEAPVIDSSFDEFVHGHIASLDRYAYALTSDRHAAEDLVQETLIRVAGAWRRIHDDGNPAGYATTVMFRTYVSFWRARRRRPQTVEMTIEPSSGGDDFATVDTRLQLRQALRTLPKMQRAVLVATYLQDFTDDEIAHVLGRAASTVRSLRHRGLKTLSAALGYDEASAQAEAVRVTGKEVNHGESGISAA